MKAFVRIAADYLSDRWVKSLSFEHKALFAFILGQTKKGIWNGDLDTIEHLCGKRDFDWPAFREACGNRLRDIPGKQEVWIPMWIIWQTGIDKRKLKRLGGRRGDGGNFFKSCLAALEEFGLDQAFLQEFYDIEPEPVPTNGSHPKEEPIGRASVSHPLLTASPEFAASWERWRKYKVERNTPLTSLTQGSLFDQIQRECSKRYPNANPEHPAMLAKALVRVSESIEYAIGKGWAQINFDEPNPLAIAAQKGPTIK
jgi:hypothetical protein